MRLTYLIRVTPTRTIMWQYVGQDDLYIHGDFKARLGNANYCSAGQLSLY